MDERALRILFDTYWSPRGWKSKPQQNVSPEDFTYAKAAGVMFDPLSLDHDEIVKRLIQARDSLDIQQVANAFLASLSTRRLNLRSALGSFAVFRHLPRHGRAPRHQRGHRCSLCGWYLLTETQDINICNFTRFKWGGVGHDDLLSAMIDLELFSREAQSDPTHDDIRIFTNLITEIDAAPPKTTATQLQARWAHILKSNKDERNIITEILGFCGILETATHEGYRHRFISVGERELNNSERAYPACWWLRSDGINRDALQEWFGHIL